MTFCYDLGNRSRLYVFFLGLQNLDEAQSSPGLHAAAGPGLAEECATLVYYITCREF